MLSGAARSCALEMRHDDLYCQRIIVYASGEQRLRMNCTVRTVDLHLLTDKSPRTCYVVDRQEYETPTILAGSSGMIRARRWIRRIRGKPLCTILWWRCFSKAPGSQGEVFKRAFAWYNGTGTYYKMDWINFDTMVQDSMMLAIGGGGINWIHPHVSLRSYNWSPYIATVKPESVLKE